MVTPSEVASSAFAVPGDDTTPGPLKAAVMVPDKVSRKFRNGEP